jgi:hypothetical protein
MKKNRKNVLIVLCVVCAAAAVAFAGCKALLSNAKEHPLLGAADADEAEILAAELVSAEPVAAAVCCTGAGDAAMIIDGNTGNMWGTPWSDNTSDAYHAHGSQHYINLDLGQVYKNVTRIEYVPAWSWGGPGGYSGNNNGICREFEVYVTEQPVPEGQKAPAESLAGYGEWFAFENGSNSNQTAATQKFFATFSSRSGRYIQFRFVSAYYNHWAGYPNVAKIAQAAELRVWTTLKPYELDKSYLSSLAVKADALRSNYLPRYGYTNAILNNWLAKAQSYLAADARPTREMVKYVEVNLKSYLDLAAKRANGDTYDRFVPKILWADNLGNHLQAHGGGLLWDPESQKYWFYGEDRTSSNGGGQPGVHAYSSEDLYNWKDEGVAMPVFNNTAYDTNGWKAIDWDGDSAMKGDRKIGFITKVNQWRKALGDWNCDGVIDANDAPYRIAADLKTELTGARQVPWWDPADSATWGDPSAAVPNPPNQDNDRGYLIDEQTLVDSGLWPSAASLWAEIGKYIPSGNPPLYVEDGPDSRPYAGALGLTSAKIAEFNALYANEPVWRRKQIYRYYNFQSTIERPKVIFNPNVGERYTDKAGNEYPYIMFIHLEAGVYDGSYGTARVAIAAARKPQGPYKFLWGYKIHFVENLRSSSNGFNKGMSRDQGVMVDSDGTAYQFGSTEENRFMCINKLDRTFTRFEGIPEYAAGGNQTEMLIEGYQNRMGVNFNWLFANQREAPAPFVHYQTAGMTLDGEGANTPQDAVKRYYAVTSTSTGWFPNPQGMYRTAVPGNWILGNSSHAKPDIVEPNRLSEGTANTLRDGDTPGTNWQSGNGWIVTQNDSGNDGSTMTLLMGVAGDGSHVNKGYDGQTTHVFQLRYPKNKWGIVGYADEGYQQQPLDRGLYATPEEYYQALEALAGSQGYAEPVYDEWLDVPEPNFGKLVYGKYVYLSDSWDQYKNYDARYIWLPMRALSGTNDNTTYGPCGLKIRWMDQWRWQDFVYDLGPFKNSLTPDPAGVDIWNDIGNDIEPLAAYYRMLNLNGDVNEFKANAGKQNPGN